MCGYIEESGEQNVTYVNYSTSILHYSGDKQNHRHVSGCAFLIHLNHTVL